MLRCTGTSSLSDVLPQELERAAARDVGGLFVIRAALLAIEAMTGRIEVMDLVFVFLGDFFRLFERNRVVGLAPVKQHGALWPLVDERRYRAAVIRHRTGQ